MSTKNKGRRKKNLLPNNHKTKKMKKLIIATILFLLLAGPVMASVNPGYGADLTCITSNNTTGYNCNDKTDMFKRIAELEKRVNELEKKNCVVVEGSVKLSTLDKMDSYERRLDKIESTLDSLQDSIMGGLKNILMFLMIKK